MNFRICRVEFCASLQKFSRVRVFLVPQHRGHQVAQHKSPDDIRKF